MGLQPNRYPVALKAMSESLVFQVVSRYWEIMSDDKVTGPLTREEAENHEK
jgi:hypothetical protein